MSLLAKTFTIAAVPVLLVAGTQRAAAIPYAFAENQIQNFAVTVTAGNVMNIRGTVITTDRAGTASGRDQQALGTATDPLQATAGAGPFPGQNNYTVSAGKNLGMRGARADADTSAQSPFAMNGVASINNVAEADGAALAPGNSLSAAADSTIAARFMVAANTVMTFSFKDIIYLEADSTMGNYASATTLDNISFGTFVDGSFTALFTFTPDGSGARVIGGGSGNVTADQFNINQTIFSSDGIQGDVKVSNMAGQDMFSVTTQMLNAGEYAFIFGSRSSVYVAVRPVRPVPEAPTAALFAPPLIGLFCLRRRSGRRGG